MIDVAVIGGGISGLATADILKRNGYGVIVLERQNRAGGNALSECIGGFLMEHGPSTVNAMSDVANTVSSELGLDGKRCVLGSNVKTRYLVDDGALSGIAAHPLGFLTSNYLSLGAKIRLLGEFAVPRRTESGEETVHDFFARRFGTEFAERVVDPMVGGIFSGLAREVSMAVFSRLLGFEREHGSITRALLGRYRQGGTMPANRLFSWRDGVGALPDALSRRMGSCLLTGTGVRAISRGARSFRIRTDKSGTLEARAVVIATQPHVAALLLRDVDSDTAEAVGEIDAPPLAVVYFGFRRQDVEHPLDGLGFLTSQDQRCHLIGAQFCSTMFPGRAPDGHVSIVGYVGGARDRELARLPTRDLLHLVRDEFSRLLGIHGSPVVHQVRHWPRGLPQYAMGHVDRIARIEAARQRVPGLYLTGNYINGVSVADCLTRARATATDVSAFLQSHGKDACAVLVPDGALSF